VLFILQEEVQSYRVTLLLALLLQLLLLPTELLKLLQLVLAVVAVLLMLCSVLSYHKWHTVSNGWATSMVCSALLLLLSYRYASPFSSDMSSPIIVLGHCSCCYQPLLTTPSASCMCIAFDLSSTSASAHYIR
jgi:hypothetical protein